MACPNFYVFISYPSNKHICKVDKKRFRDIRFRGNLSSGFVNHSSRIMSKKIICSKNPKFNDQTISSNHRVQNTYDRPVVLKAFDM